ncbi:Ent-kaurene oxidase [Cytospora mali]|uniref:Ent-kaurene oxidase n=1 Tax=Cytospora mali TaxID=578113 RepID=A0A194W1E4_CYTMA|nr:Ent-kaurene oxidase [Valsa mali]
MASLHMALPPLGSPLGLALAFSVLCIVLYVVNSYIATPYPKGIALVREPPGAKRFSWRTRLTYYLDCPSLFREAYHEYAKKGKPVIIPGIGARAEIILPTSSMRWALSQPDEVMSVGDAFAEIDGAYYGLGTEKPIIDGWQGMLVKKDMNAVLENIVQAMNDELGVAFDEYLGTDTESWTEIDLLAVVRKIVSQAASRFTVGLPLCRNKAYLDASLESVDRLVINAGVSTGVPPVLQPIAGRMSGLPVRLSIRKMRKHFEPIYLKRLETLKYAKDDPNHEEPQDHLQMMLRYAEKERPHELQDLDLMTKRLVVANFGSMHQTSIQVTNMLLNILGSDAEFNTIAVLRDEVSRILGPNEGQGWTKAKVSNMIRADSVAKETLRLNSFGGRAIFRKVLVDGVVTDGGIELPKGCMINFMSQPAHMDEATYEDAQKYDPFRYSRGGSLSFVSTSPDYLPFSHGRHACPGRFLIDFELKMIIAYVLMNYDIKFPDVYGGKRPENRWVTEAYFPPAGVKIMVKRRKAV